MNESGTAGARRKSGTGATLAGAGCWAEQLVLPQVAEVWVRMVWNKIAAQTAPLRDSPLDAQPRTAPAAPASWTLQPPAPSLITPQPHPCPGSSVCRGLTCVPVPSDSVTPGPLLPGDMSLAPAPLGVFICGVGLVAGMPAGLRRAWRLSSHASRKAPRGCLAWRSSQTCSLRQCPRVPMTHDHMLGSMK